MSVFSNNFYGEIFGIPEKIPRFLKSYVIFLMSDIYGWHLCQPLENHEGAIGFIKDTSMEPLPWRRNRYPLLKTKNEEKTLSVGHSPRL